MPLAIRLSGVEKPTLLCCECNAYHSARINFGLNVNVYNNLEYNMKLRENR